MEYWRQVQNASQMRLPPTIEMMNTLGAIFPPCLFAWPLRTTSPFELAVGLADTADSNELPASRRPAAIDLSCIALACPLQAAWDGSRTLIVS